MPFEFELFAIPEVILIKPKVFSDERRFFLEIYQKSEFERTEILYEFLQDDHSASKKGVLRGLHYQKKPAVQGKLVMCIKRVIFDVAVDIRVGSPTFGKWVGDYLSEENKHMLWIPPGFVHGFLVVSNYAEVIYKVSNSEYSPAHDAGIIWNDPTIGIEWPLHLVDKVILSNKDKNLPTLKELSEEDLL
jgi:dTDP-4-dehydrorhamnose 3,5-epimerase